MSDSFRSGFIAVVGKPNVGKSTLMNHIVGAKISIVTDKAQTTRNKILGIYTRDDAQLIFVDTPGLIQADDRLNQCLVNETKDGLKEVDLIFHLVDCRDKKPMTPVVQSTFEKSNVKKILVLNKVDCVNGKIPELGIEQGYEKVFPVSALKGERITDLLEYTIEQLPEGPLYFAEDELSDRDMRFIAAELVREKVYENMAEELPYSVATQVEEFREQNGRKPFIRVLIFVERESQKQIVIGKKGNLLKQIGAQARSEIEDLMGESVFLELWVKVRKNWSKNESDLKKLGYLSK